MFDAIRKYKRILIILGVLILVFIIYSFMKGDSTANQGAISITENSNAEPQNPIGQQFFNQLLTLQNIRLDNQVFSDPRFQSLEDFSQPIPDEPQGRPNPFAPIGVDNGTVSNPNASSTNQ